MFDKVGYFSELSSAKGLNKRCDHAICVYIISIVEGYDTKFEITRGPNISEIMSIFYSNRTAVTRLKNKDLTSCSSEPVIITVQAMKSIAFSIVWLREDWEFNVKIYQEDETDTQFMLRWFFFIILFLSVITMILTGSINIWKYIKEVDKENSRPQYLSIKLAIIIQKFRNLNVRFEQTSCTICIEEFAADSQVWIVKACNHIFHKDWLLEWIEKTVSFQLIVCPYWRAGIEQTES